MKLVKYMLRIEYYSYWRMCKDVDKIVCKSYREAKYKFVEWQQEKSCDVIYKAEIEPFFEKEILEVL